jgi:hypothetical protein
MTKLRLAATAVMTSCGLMLAGGAGTAVAQDTATSLTEPIAMTGTAKNGKKFTGTYKVKRFVAEGDDVFAVGTLKGRLKGRQVRRTGVRIPVSGASSGETGLAQTSQQPGTCRVLDLTLGPLDLNLLGLRVQLNQVHLQITAIRSGFPGGGLLGDLLCGIANLLNPAQANPVGSALAQILNAILALLPQSGTTAALPR